MQIVSGTHGILKCHTETINFGAISLSESNKCNKTLTEVKNRNFVQQKTT